MRAALNTWHTVTYCLNVDVCLLGSCGDFHRHKVSHQHFPPSLPWKTKQGCKLVCFMRCDVSFLIPSREKYDCHKSSFFFFFLWQKKRPSSTRVMTTTEEAELVKRWYWRKWQASNLASGCDMKRSQHTFDFCLIAFISYSDAWLLKSRGKKM